MSSAFSSAGNAASLLLFISPVLTFRRVIRKRSTEKFSCIPYIIALLNCLFYTWYGLPVVSIRWENFPVATINGSGIIFESSFILVYLWFATNKGRKKVAAVLIPVIILFTVTAFVSAFAFHDHRHRKMFVGLIGLSGSIGMYSSPLVAVKRVIKTKSVDFMPFYLSFFSFLASSLWLAYGLLSHDIVLASPNLVGCPVGIVQLVVYFMYRKKGVILEEPETVDVEQNAVKPADLQLVIKVDNENCKS